MGKKNSLCYMTCYRAFKQGKIPNAFQLPSGTIVVPDVSGNNKKDYTVVYARVSSSQNRSNLKSQAKRLVEFCTANGWVVNEVIEECGSGLNDQKPKLNQIFDLTEQHKITKIVVEHSDRLTRFLFLYLKDILKVME